MSQTGFFSFRRKLPFVPTAVDLLEGRGSAYGPIRNGRENAMKTRSSVVQTHGRGQVIAPQQLINLAVKLRKDEGAQRAIEARGEQSNMYGPPSENDADFGARKGMLAFCVPKAGASFRQSITADSGVEIITSANGLSRDTPLAYPVVVQTDSDPQDKISPDNLAVTMQGTQTIVMTGCESVTVVAQLYADPNPYLVQDANGKLVPGIQGPVGVPKSHQHFQVRELNSSSLHHFETYFQNQVRVRMGTTAFATSLAEAKDDMDLHKLIHTHCDEIFEGDKHVAIDMPIRGHIVLFFVDLLHNMMSIPDFLAGSVSDADRVHYKFMTLRAKVQVIKDVEEKFTQVNRDYDATMPHDTTHYKPSIHSDTSRSSIHSNHMKVLLTPIPLPGDGGADDQAVVVKMLRNLEEANARINMIWNSRMSIMSHDQRSYEARFKLGTALCSATKGGQLDILLGDHR